MYCRVKIFVVSLVLRKKRTPTEILALKNQFKLSLLKIGNNIIKMIHNIF